VDQPRNAFGQRGQGVRACDVALQPLDAAVVGGRVAAQRGHLVATRLLRGDASSRLIGKACLYGGMIARLPFVRMVAITGSLAVDNADKGDDIDYLIVTAPGRVWLARALTMAVVRLAALRGVTVCPNYLLSEEALALPEQDRYTARELLQMRPLSGDRVYRRLLAANAWWRDYLPNALAAAAVSDGGGVLQRLGELLLRPVAGRLEAWVYRRKAAELAAQAEAGNGEVVFDATMCKGHFEGHRRRTAEALAQRLRRLEEPLP
jgi:hypothetical protein